MTHGHAPGLPSYHSLPRNGIICNERYLRCPEPMRERGRVKSEGADEGEGGRGRMRRICDKEHAKRYVVIKRRQERQKIAKGKMFFFLRRVEKRWKINRGSNNRKTRNRFDDSSNCSPDRQDQKKKACDIIHYEGGGSCVSPVAMKGASFPPARLSSFVSVSFIYLSPYLSYFLSEIPLLFPSPSFRP